MRTVPIERIDAPSPEVFHRDIYPQRKPFILTGATREWNTRAWSPEYLKQKVGSAKVPAHLVTSTGLTHADSPPILIPFDELVDRVVAGKPGERCVLYNEDLHQERYDRLLDDMRLPGYVDVARLAYSNLWVSGGNFHSRLHFDSLGCHNLNVQIKGSKRVLMFDPDDAKYVYLNDATAGPNHNYFCAYDPFLPDEAQFPEASRAVCHAGVLNEGDALYHPAIWLHAFEHTGTFNVNANYWWWQLEYPPTGHLRRWMFLESITAFMMDLSRRTSKPLAPEEIPPEVARFILEMERFLLRHDAVPIFAAAPHGDEVTIRQRLDDHRRRNPGSKYLPATLPPAMPLRTG